MEKKIYVVGMNTEEDQKKADEAVKTVTGVTNVTASALKAQVLVNFDESVSEIENSIATSLSSLGFEVLN